MFLKTLGFLGVLSKMLQKNPPVSITLLMKKQCEPITETSGLLPANVRATDLQIGSIETARTLTSAINSPGLKTRITALIPSIFSHIDPQLHRPGSNADKAAVDAGRLGVAGGANWVNNQPLD